MILAAFDLSPLTLCLNFRFYIYICSFITRFVYAVTLHRGRENWNYGDLRALRMILGNIFTVHNWLFVRRLPSKMFKSFKVWLSIVL